MKSTLFRVTLGALLAALCLAAVLPTAAYAQEGGEPPVPPAEGPAPEEGADAAAENEAAPDEAADEASDEAVDEAASAEAAEPEAEEPAEPEGGLLADLPEGTELVVLDAEGEPLPLASQAAEQAIIAGDPQWCPTSATPGAKLGDENSLWEGGNNCSPSFTKFTDLWLWLFNNDPGVNGTIWVAWDYSDLDGHTEMDGDLIAITATKTLVIQGGWTGNGKQVNQNDPSKLEHALQITNWKNDITLNDVIITNSTFGSHALFIQTSGKITLNRVQVIDNTDGAALLDNQAGNKDVVVNASTFSGHAAAGAGLEVKSNGLITLKDIDASGNAGWGLLLNNNVFGVSKGITLAGSNAFIGNGGGVSISTRGPVTLNNVVATHNTTSFGVQINNAAAVTAQPVKLTGKNVFMYNFSSGLSITSNGAVSLAHITASENGFGSSSVGATINNTGTLGDQAVTFTGKNTFNYNDTGGLLVASNGVISISNLTAEGNADGIGVELDNHDSAAPRAVTLSGVTKILSNGITFGHHGLSIWSKGAVNISNLTASLNGKVGFGGDGVNINNSGHTPQAVNITGLALFEKNGNDGLEVNSDGVITVRNAAARENGSAGLRLNNSSSSAMVGVTVQGLVGGVSPDANFYDNTHDGVRILSRGNVAVSQSNFVDNNAYGLHIDNTAGTGNVTLSWAGAGCMSALGNMDSGIAIFSKGAVSLGVLCASGNGVHGAEVSNFTPVAPKGVTLTRGTFNDNTEMGLRIQTDGAITLANVKAEGNELGVYLNNTISLLTKPQAIRLNGDNVFKDSDQEGLYITSSGVVAISNLTAWNNGGTNPTNGYSGVLVDNGTLGANSQQPVTLSGYVSVKDNWRHGLQVFSYGAITLNNITATNNGNGHTDDADKFGYGVYLVNEHSDNLKAMAVTLNGTNKFDLNRSTGLFVFASGAIKINNLQADNTYVGSGAELDNEPSLTKQGVSITGYARFDNNKDAGLAHGYGLQVNSRGAITLTNVTATNNDNHGVYLYSKFAATTGAVTLNGNNSFVGNGISGLVVESNAAIKINNLNASGQPFNGASLQNHGGGAAANATVTLTGKNSFVDNGKDGLIIESNKAVTLTNLTVSGSIDGYGVWIKNIAGGETSPQNVSLNGTNLIKDNDLSGLFVQTFGNIQASNLTASGNGFGGNILDPSERAGAWLENCGYSVGFSGCMALSAAPRTVKLTGTNSFVGNAGHGLFVGSYGAISLNAVTANDSDTGHGVWLRNDWDNSVTASSITITGVNNFNNNFRYGLIANSNGRITISNLTANSNEGGGAWLASSRKAATAAAAAPITLTGKNTLVGNLDLEGWGSGLRIQTDSQVNLSKLVAEGNTSDGVYIDQLNAWVNVLGAPAGIPVPGINITGITSFYENGGSGLVYASPGAVVLSKVHADQNDFTGVQGVSFTLTMSCSSINSNINAGLDLETTDGGAITLLGVVSGIEYGNGMADSLVASGQLIIKRGC